MGAGKSFTLSLTQCRLSLVSQYFPNVCKPPGIRVYYKNVLTKLVLKCSYNFLLTINLFYLQLLSNSFFWRLEPSKCILQQKIESPCFLPNVPSNIFSAFMVNL